MTSLLSHGQLKRLLKRQESNLKQLDDHKRLYEESKSIVTARMENGTGSTAEGAVEDTIRIMVSSGVDDLWLELTLREAQVWVQKRIVILEKRAADLEKPIAILREEHALVRFLLSTLENGSTETVILK
ncbi:hypothetical protein JCM5353_005848 [Sporobolomyces roseus]